MEKVVYTNRLRMFLRQNVHRVLIKKNFLRIIIKKYFYATTMRPRIHYTQQSSSWRRVARIVSANRMLRDRTLSIALRYTLVAFSDFLFRISVLYGH